MQTVPLVHGTRTTQGQEPVLGKPIIRQQSLSLPTVLLQSTEQHVRRILYNMSHSCDSFLVAHAHALCHEVLWESLVIQNYNCQIETPSFGAVVIGLLRY
jgi:hypothetical protein